MVKINRRPNRIRKSKQRLEISRNQNNLLMEQIVKLQKQLEELQEQNKNQKEQIVNHKYSLDLVTKESLKKSQRFRKHSDRIASIMSYDKNVPGYVIDVKSDIDDYIKIQNQHMTEIEKVSSSGIRPLKIDDFISPSEYIVDPSGHVRGHKKEAWFKDNQDHYRIWTPSYGRSNFGTPFGSQPTTNFGSSNSSSNNSDRGLQATSFGGFESQQPTTPVGFSFSFNQPRTSIESFSFGATPSSTNQGVFTFGAEPLSTNQGGFTFGAVPSTSNSGLSFGSSRRLQQFTTPFSIPETKKGNDTKDKGK
jgi:hypothetical protein